MEEAGAIKFTHADLSRVGYQSYIVYQHLPSPVVSGHPSTTERLFIDTSNGVGPGI